MDTSTSVSASRSSRHLALVMCAALLWGTVGVTTQAIYRLTPTNALSIGFFRLAIAAPLLTLACQLTLRRRAWRIARRDLALMALIGVMLALYQACYFAAIARIGVTVSTLVTLCLAPVLVACLAPLWTHERLTPVVALALLAALIGIGCVVVGKPGAGGALQLNDALGVLLAGASALGYAIVTLVGRTLAPKYHALQINAVGFTTGALLLLGLALATGFVVAYPPQGWLLLGYLGVVPTAVAYVFFLSGMRATPATVASIATLLEPLTASVLAAILFGERLGTLGIVGALLLLGALASLSLGSARAKGARHEAS